MSTPNIFFALIICFSVSLISVFLLKRFARRMKLVDAPDHRKNHQGHIPLVGGISIFLGAGSAFLFFPHLSREITALSIAALLVVVIGVLDDQFDLKVRHRLAMQFVAALVIIIGGDMSIQTLGVYGSQSGFQLGVFSVPFTIFSIMVAMNAFNFVDGIDGLSGLLFMVTMLAIIVLSSAENGSNINNYLIPLLLMIAVIPYMAFNLGLLGADYRVFLGDAGSMLLGLLAAWLLIHYTQDPISTTFSPVTALWIIAIPLMDMLAIVIRRARKGRAPFHPDRNHLHHLFMDRGMSDRQALASIGLMAILFAGVGIITEQYEVSNLIMLVVFLLIFAAYYRLMSFFEKQKQQETD